MNSENTCSTSVIPRFDLSEVAPLVDSVDLFMAWAAEHQDQMTAALHDAGALRLLNTPIGDDIDFGKVAPKLCGELAPYVEGSSERLQLVPRVYTSTEYPAQYDISLHNELSYASAWPDRLAFVCLVAAETGGATSLCDGRALLRSLPDDIVAEFTERNVRYVRNLRSEDVRGLGLTWQAVFETKDRNAVEEYCRDERVDFAWRPDGTLHTEQIRPAVAVHPVTGDQVWFNQADQFHPTNLGRQQALDIVEILGVENLPIHATFGDGGEIGADVLDEIRRCTASLTINEPWHEREVLLIDNMLMMHGRSAFTGDRRILVSMGS